MLAIIFAFIHHSLVVLYSNIKIFVVSFLRGKTLTKQTLWIFLDTLYLGIFFYPSLVCVCLRILKKKTFKNKIINFLVCSPKPFLLMKPTYSSWEFSSSRLNGEIKLTFTRRFSKLNKIWNKKKSGNSYWCCQM